MSPTSMSRAVTDESTSTLGQVEAIVRDVLDLPTLSLTPSTSAPEVPSWDSLSNIQLVVAVERHFKIRFTADEVRGFHNVGEMCDCIDAKVRVKASSNR